MKYPLMYHKNRGGKAKLIRIREVKKSWREVTGTTYTDHNWSSFITGLSIVRKSIKIKNSWFIHLINIDRFNKVLAAQNNQHNT